MTIPSHLANDLIEAGQRLYQAGLVPATSGNFSARVNAEEIAITVSGRHKGRLDNDGLMLIDYQGRAAEPALRSSAETLLHTRLYQRYEDIGCVLHTHSRHATVLSRLLKDDLVLQGYELQKAFRGIDSHDCRLCIPIFANTQDIPALAQQVDAYLDKHENVHGYLIAGHGLYTWGRTVEEAERHIEAFEFLFTCELQMMLHQGTNQ